MLADAWGFKSPSCLPVLKLLVLMLSTILYDEPTTSSPSHPVMVPSSLSFISELSRKALACLTRTDEPHTPGMTYLDCDTRAVRS